MNKLLCFLGGALLLANAHSQKIEIKPFFIGDRVPDLPLHRIINYKDTSATLSSFGDKLIILDFWDIHCSSCIEMFPFEDSLQQALNNKLQFILVTLDPKAKVVSFFQRWDSIHHIKFSLPVVCSDSVLCYLFRHHSVPHYAWLSPDGSLLAQTENKYFLNTATIEQVMDPVLQIIDEMRKEHFPDEMIHYPKPPAAILKAVEANRFPVGFKPSF